MRTRRDARDPMTVTMRGSSIVLNEIPHWVRVEAVTIVRPGGESIVRPTIVAALRQYPSFARRDMSDVRIDFTSPSAARERLMLSAPPTQSRVLADGLSYTMIFATVRLDSACTPTSLASTPRRILGIGGAVDAGGVLRTAVALGWTEEIWLLDHSVTELTTQKATHATAGALLRVGSLVQGTMHEFAERCRQLGAAVYVEGVSADTSQVGVPADGPTAVVVGAPDAVQQFADLKPQLLSLRVDDGSPSAMATASIALHQLSIALRPS